MAADDWRVVLAVPLFPPRLTEQVKLTLVSGLWRASPTSVDEVNNFDAYFQYLKEECHHQLQRKHAARTLADLVNIVDYLKSNPRISMSELCDGLHLAQPQLGNDLPKISASVELAVRLWLMINVRNLMPNDPRTLQTAIPWPDTSSLQEVVQRWNPASAAKDDVPRRQLPDTLNAFDIERITSYRIVWTDDLLNHLVLDGKAIYLYYHVSVLKRIEMSGLHGLLPPELIEETQRTLALLLPNTNSSCNAWLRDSERRWMLDPNIKFLPAASRDLGEYKYWRDRLLMISDAFDKSKPDTTRQWWYDRRDKVQWYHFWLVIVGITLVVFFGLVQSVTGIVQAWASVEGLKCKPA